MARAVLVLPDGSEIKPLTKVPPLVAASMSAMKVMIAAEGDAGGANTHILLFPSKDKKGNKVIDAKSKSKLRLKLKADKVFEETIFTWYTPFDAVTTVPPCHKCKEKISAKWSFCPWCGVKLDT
jgi:hypothetical protein